MKSEHKANESLAQVVEAFQAEQAEWVRKLAAPAKVIRPAAKPVKVGFFNRLFYFN